jgi:hypothetical protein
MLFIGLDVSKISTALCIEKNGVTKLYSYTTKKDNNTWIKQTSQFINYRNINYNYSKETDYSKSELLKLGEFDAVTDLIINDIFDNIKILDSVRIGIEGFSYNSTGPIFDIIEFTTILKYKLMNKIEKYSIIEILSPMTLKSETCKMIYEPRIELKGKKVIKEILHIENDKGKQANKFDKWDMFYAFLKSDMKLEFKDWCIENQEVIYKGKEVFKPGDDIIDAFFITQIIKRKYSIGNN